MTEFESIVGRHFQSPTCAGNGTKNDVEEFLKIPQFCSWISHCVKLAFIY